MQQAFEGAPTYITYLTSGIICLILVFNMAFGGIDLVLDKQLGSPIHSLPHPSLGLPSTSQGSFKTW